MKQVLVYLIFALQQDATPYKPREEFEVKLDFEFRDRATMDANKIEYNQTQKEYERSRSGPLPYLNLNLRVLKPVPEEVRVRVIANGTKTVLNKKFDMASVLKLEMGYTDDIKDRISTYEYTVYYLSADKKPLSKVVVMFEEGGAYFVNGELRGKL